MAILVCSPNQQPAGISSEGAYLVCVINSIVDDAFPVLLSENAGLPDEARITTYKFDCHHQEVLRCLRSIEPAVLKTASSTIIRVRAALHYLVRCHASSLSKNTP